MDRQKLIWMAVDGLGRSYTPYPHSHVSAALSCVNGTVYTGNNIENAVYTLSVCAERCAIFKAVGDGRKEFEAITVYGGPDGVVEDYCPPRGVCRQVMREFCDPSSFRVLVAKTAEDYRGYTLERLLPGGFGSDHLTGSGER